MRPRDVRGVHEKPRALQEPAPDAVVPLRHPLPDAVRGVDREGSRVNAMSVEHLSYNPVVPVVVVAPHRRF